MGFEENDIDLLSQNAFKDITSFTSPRKATVENITNIFKVSM
jgi:alcohol dehydrogenase class IV